MALPLDLLADADSILVCSVQEEAVAAQPIQALIQAVVLASDTDSMALKSSMEQAAIQLLLSRRGMDQQAGLQVEVLELLVQMLAMVALVAAAHAMETVAPVGLALSLVAAAAVAVDHQEQEHQVQADQAAQVA